MTVYEIRRRNIFKKLTNCSVSQQYNQIKRHYYQLYDTALTSTDINCTHYGTLQHPETSYSLTFNINKGAFNLSMPPDQVVLFQDFFMPKVYSDGYFATVCPKFKKFTNIDIYGVMVTSQSQPNVGELYRVIQDRSNPSNPITYYAEKLSAMGAFNIDSTNGVLNGQQPFLFGDVNVQVTGSFQTTPFRFLQRNGYNYFKVTTLAVCLGKIKDVAIQTLATPNACTTNTSSDWTEPGDQLYAGGQFAQTGNYTPEITAAMRKLYLNSNLSLSGVTIPNGSVSIFSNANYLGAANNYRFQPEALTESFKLFVDEQISANQFANYSLYTNSSSRYPMFGSEKADVNQALGGVQEAEYALYWMLLHLSKGRNRLSFNGFDFTKTGVVRSLDAEIESFGDMDFWKL